MSKNKKLLSKGRNILFAFLLAFGAIVSPLLGGQAFAASHYLNYRIGNTTNSNENDSFNNKRFYKPLRATKDTLLTFEAAYNASKAGGDDDDDIATLDGYMQTHTFVGWKCDGAVRQPGADVTNVKKGQDLDCTAWWAPKATVNLNGTAVTSADIITLKDGDADAGTIAFDKFPAAQGYSLKVTVTPSEDYIVKTFKVDDVDKTLDGNEYTISSLGATTNYTVEFIRTYDIVASVAGGNGSVSPLGETVNKGDSFDLSITPDTGWHLSKLTINGDVANFSGSTYHVESVEEDMEFEATFERDTHLVSVYADAGVTVTPIDPEVYYGDDQVFSISIAKGYELLAIALDGTEVTEGIEGEAGEYTYTIENITENTELGVYTLAEEYEIIDGDGQEVDYEADGANLTFRFDGDLDLFRAFYIDDVEVPAENYDTVSGSTIISVHYDYLPTIGNGEHIAKALYANGNFAEASFMLKNLPEVPDTGVFSTLFDGSRSNVIIFSSIAALMTSLGIFFTLRKYSRK